LSKITFYYLKEAVALKFQIVFKFYFEGLLAWRLIIDGNSGAYAAQRCTPKTAAHSRPLLFE
jgi:hypothetical protein